MSAVRAAEQAVVGTAGSAFVSAVSAPLFNGVDWPSVLIGVLVAALAGLAAALNKWVDDRDGYDAPKWARDFFVGGIAGIGAFWLIALMGVTDGYAQLAAMAFSGWAGPAALNLWPEVWRRLKQ